MSRKSWCRAESTKSEYGAGATVNPTRSGDVFERLKHMKSRLNQTLSTHPGPTSRQWLVRQGERSGAGGGQQTGQGGAELAAGKGAAPGVRSGRRRHQGRDSQDDRLVSRRSFEVVEDCCIYRALMYLFFDGGGCGHCSYICLTESVPGFNLRSIVVTSSYNSGGIGITSGTFQTPM